MVGAGGDEGRADEREGGRLGLCVRIRQEVVIGGYVLVDVTNFGCR